MEQKQSKHGLRVAAAIMFVLLCAVEMFYIAVYFAGKEDYIFRHADMFRNALTYSLAYLIYAITFAMIAAGLFAQKKGAGLRITFGILCVILLITKIVLLIGKVNFNYVLRTTSWNEIFALVGAAACLFAIRRVSVAGVGFGMYALLELNSIIDVAVGFRLIDRIVVEDFVLFLIFAFVAVVFFLNDNARKPGRLTKSFGIITLVLNGIWFMYRIFILVYADIPKLRRGGYIPYFCADTCFMCFLFCGVLFAIIAIAFLGRAHTAAALGADRPYRQPYVPQERQPYAPQYQQPTRQQTVATQPPQPTKGESPWFCTQCGAQNSASSRFCRNCGAKSPVGGQPASGQSAGQTSSNPGTLNWEQYAPLDAGVSMKADKDYKFHRADGFVGSIPQKFVDRTFVKCPLCCSANPGWTISQHNQMSWKGNLYLFKCSCCGGIISMSMPDVTTLGNGGSGVAMNPSVGLTNLMVKASSGKEAGAVYAVIESVGNSGVTPACQGKEFKLEQLQQMSLRT